MRQSMRRADVVGLAVVAAALATVGAVLAWGPLNPPAGPVVSTGKSLGEVQPRIPMNFTTTPSTQACWFRIAQPGSYYLTGNITALPSQSGICIASNNVTIDLSGFTITGTQFSFDGIMCEASYDRITIQSGKISGMGRNGIDLESNGTNFASLIEDVQVANCPGFGIRTGRSAIVRRCTVRGTGGFSASNYAIRAANDAIVELCTVNGNSGSGISVGGISIVRNCTSTNNGFEGIVYTGSAQILDNEVSFNPRAGIWAQGDGGLVRGNVSLANFGPGQGANYLISGTNNRIEGNHSATAARGFHVTGGHNIIINNTSADATTAFDIVGSNRYGPIVDIRNAGTAATSANTGAPSTMLTTDPYANFVK